MDKTLVNLEICIKYENNENPYKSKFTEFKTFEELKNISIKHFNIQKEEEIEMMKFTSENKSFIVNNDNDLISCMKEIDEYNFSINLELSIDKTILENKKKLKQLFLNKLYQEFLSSLKLLKKWLDLKKELNEKINYYIQNSQGSLYGLLKEFPNTITLSKKENDEKINNIDDNLFCSKLVLDIREKFNKKMEEIKIKQESFQKQIQHNFDDIFDLIKKNKTNIIIDKNKNINEIKIGKDEGKNNMDDKNQGIKYEGNTPKPMHGKIIEANIINNYY
jgi:uncharacterized protein YqgV (UPF0045/DUF77 family)